MARVVVLLRAVNLGKARKVPMAALRAALEAAGCSDVVSYIQSGNLVITPPEPEPADLAAWLEDVIADHAGIEVPVVLRTADEIEQTVARNPYPTAGGTQLHVVFFAEQPATGALAEVDPQEFAPDEFALVGRDLYLHLPDGMARTKLPGALERAGRKAGPPAVGTARNWNTVLKMRDLVSNTP